MPNSTSTEKRVRQSEKRRRKNKSVKSKIKTQKQKVQDRIDEDNFSAAEEELNELFSICDRAAGKGIIHKNKADRIKSRMSSRLQDARESDSS